MKKYPSKISIGLTLIVLTILIGSSLPMISPPIWPGLFINFCILLLMVYLILDTYYIIKGDILIVKCGFLVNKKIDINKVDLISETNSVISAPAISLDRLDIIYNGHEGILISPRNKLKFIEHMIRINPSIKVQFKSSKKS
jgi:hypothetical protein